MKWGHPWHSPTLIQIWDKIWKHVPQGSTDTWQQTTKCKFMKQDINHNKENTNVWVLVEILVKIQQNKKFNCLLEKKKTKQQKKKKNTCQQKSRRVPQTYYTYLLLPTTLYTVRFLCLWLHRSYTSQVHSKWLLQGGVTVSQLLACSYSLEKWLHTPVTSPNKT